MPTESLAPVKQIWFPFTNLVDLAFREPNLEFTLSKIIMELKQFQRSLKGTIDLVSLINSKQIFIIEIGS